MIICEVYWCLAMIIGRGDLSASGDQNFYHFCATSSNRIVQGCFASIVFRVDFSAGDN